jgi:Dienelactone hydrolase and related enzymes
MKRLLSLIFWLLYILPAFGQSIEGSWNGQLEVGDNKLRLVINIARQDSLYVGTMDSPDQGAKGIPLSTISFTSPDLSFDISQLGVLYEGKLQADTLIVGTFTQSGVSFPLSLVKGKPVINRPQEPKSPYPYGSEEVSFNSKSPDVVLTGTLTLPLQSSTKVPTVILVSGSGPQNRDEEIFDHKPFLVIADYLTRNGIAVLRYDDRGFGESTGNFTTATTEDFMHDALGAFDFLLSRDEIDSEKIGILGHSEGGTIAFMAAAQNPDIAFIVSLAGMALRGDSLLVWQNRDIMLAQGFALDMVNVYCGALKKVFAVIQNKPHEYIVQNNDHILPDIMGDIEVSVLPEKLRQNLETILTAPISPWIKYMLSLDLGQYIRQVKCPVLAINGDKDLQVNAEINLATIEQNLKVGGNQDYTIRKYDGLNHLFQNATTGLTMEYGQIEETIAPEVLREILLWINENMLDFILKS